MILLILLVSTASAGFLFLNNKVEKYTLIPEDTSFYLGLSVKNHPQVQKLLDLTAKFPGGEKMVKLVDENRQELFGTRKDPFKEILDLAESEIFLAKISRDEPAEGQFFTNPLEKLVNIVSFDNKKTASGKFSDLEKNANITTSKEAYGSAKIAKFELKEQSEDETSQQFSTGALPYQVTLPLSKTIFASNIDNLIVSAEKESDLKKIIDLATNAQEDRKSTRLNSSHT